MHVRNILEEDFVNYKIPSMFIGTCKCNFKCCTEQGLPISVCQNSELYKSPIKYYDDGLLIDLYLGNPLTGAIVFGGMEPIEQIGELIDFISKLRSKSLDPVIIYTGYNKEEIAGAIESLRNFKNIIIKFGRYVPHQSPHYDEILGVQLASDNQYAEQIS